MTPRQWALDGRDRVRAGEAMEFSILGPLEVRADDRTVALGGVKPRALLTVLLLRANQSVSAEHLALALWGDDAPPGVVKTVQVHISRLRRALGESEVLVTTSGGYELRVRPGELDLERFERYLENGREALAASKPEEAAAALHEALALWRGPPLAELSALPFAASEISRLEERRLAALELRVEADLAVGRHGNLIAELQHITNQHPWRERLHGQLMLALYRAGRQTEALQVYRTIRGRLVDELGVEPGPDLRGLEVALLNQDPGLAWADPRAPRLDVPVNELFVARRDRQLERLMSTTIRGGSLIGREREQATLKVALDRLQAGRGGLALVSGEAGVGKTRLVEDELRASGVAFLRGDAPEHAGPPYGPIAAVLREALRLDPHALDDCGPFAAMLGLLLPEVGDPPPEGDQATVVEAISGAFRSIARVMSTVVFLDDLQWADAATCELLPALTSGLEQERVLLVGAYRSDELARGHPLRRARSDLRRAGRLNEIALDPLDSSHTSELAGRVLGADPSVALADRLYDRTQGFPFYIEELCAALVAAGAVVETPAGLELVEGDQLPLPETLRDAVLARAEPLSSEARSVLEAACVAGSRFDLALIADLTGEAAIDDAVSAGILVEIEPGIAAFRHGLTREAFYLDVPWGRRRILHRRLAELLDMRGARPEVLAEHWASANEPGRAREAFLTAAQDFQAAHAYRDALEWCRRALALWPSDDESGRLALLERLGRCAELSSELAAAASAWTEVADARQADGDMRAAAEIQRRLSVVYELQGLPERALAARDRAAQAFGTAGEHAEAAAELLAAASQLEAMGGLSPALELITQGARHTEQVRRPDLVARRLGLEGTLRAKLGDLDAGLRLAREGLAIALGDNLSATATELYLRYAAVLENAVDLDGAEEVYEEAYDFCVANGAEPAGQVCLVCLAYVIWQTGRWDDAESLERTIIADAHSPPGVRAAARSALGIFSAARGRTTGTRPMLIDGLSYAQRHHRLRFELNTLVGLAWLEELERNVGAAAERYREIVQRCGQAEDLHYAPMALRSAVTFFADRGELSEARSCAAVLADMAAATTNRETLAALAHALGELALLDRGAEQAVSEFGRSLDVLSELQLPFQRACTQLRAATANTAAGRTEDAVALLRDASTTAQSLGAEPLAAAAVDALERLRATAE
jgi:DNA-binding SARP family transcriptional activator